MRYKLAVTKLSAAFGNAPFSAKSVVERKKTNKRKNDYLMLP